jgi:hypothetical protein
MGLFTDGTVSTIEDLLGSESSILEVARTEKIDLTNKLSLACQEIGIELSVFLSQQSGTESPELGGRKLELENVVVTEPLRKWHTHYTLALVYRDAYNSQLNDRYSGKWKAYEQLARRASAALFEIGVGMVSEPLVQAGKPTLSWMPGSLAGATYFAKVSWVDAYGTEGSASEPGVLSVPDGSLLVVAATEPPGNARAWNVYAGLAADQATLQNDGPLGLGQPWTEAETGLKAGRKPGSGQAPEWYLKVIRSFRRG